MSPDTGLDGGVMRVHIVFTEVPLVFERLVTDDTGHSLTGRMYVDHMNTEVACAAEPALA